jgi:glycolate oxidase FAD binding subunit
MIQPSAAAVPVAASASGDGATSLAGFAEEVGSAGPVCVVGGRTQWTVGGLPAPGTREVRAPSGVVRHEPAEMIVRVRAGTPVAELASVLAQAGQMVPLDPADPGQATVGGVLAVGHSGWRRLRYGPIRDTVLEVRFVSAEGRLIKAGGPVVKNVTGFDLCRLLVGSVGTLGLLAEVVLRCYPVPEVSRWYGGEPADPLGLAGRLYRASAVLWDGAAVWVLLEGHPDDVAAQAASVLGPAFAPVEYPVVPEATTGRLSVPVAHLPRLAGLAGRSSGAGWVAELGVGTVHTDQPAALAEQLGVTWPAAMDERVASLNAAVKARFDPTGRLNPGRMVP